MKGFSTIVWGMLSTTACTILFAGLANAQAATDVVCSGCVDRSDIATQAISSSKLKGQAVIRSKIQDNAINDAKLSIGLRTRITDLEAVNDPTQTQVRVGGSCAVGSFIAAIAEDGSVTCENGGDVNNSTRYGEAALANNTGMHNTASGNLALTANTTGWGNTATGAVALTANTTGNVNTATGAGALESNTIGSANTATGLNALLFNTEGSNNTANGTGALNANTTGNQNTAIGEAALHDNTTGFDNAASGKSALFSNTIGNVNTAMGAYALHFTTEGAANSANGQSAGYSNTTGSFNTASGQMSLWANTIGSNNIAMGYRAGEFLTTGDRNIAIGHQGVAGDSNTIRVGNANHTRVFVHGIQGRTTGIDDAVTVVIDSNGQMGTMSSSRRYKQDINDMGQASDRLLQLRPVTFRYQEAYENGEQPLDYGLIAEEVAEVFPELVVFNQEGQPETVKYRLLSSLLLNELQKQQQINRNQEKRLVQMDDILMRLEHLETASGSNVVITAD